MGNLSPYKHLWLAGVRREYIDEIIGIVYFQIKNYSGMQNIWRWKKKRQNFSPIKLQ